MSNNNINSSLYRRLSPGLAYDKLIEKTGCKVTRLGDGNTYFSIDKIKEYSLEFQYQTKKVAAQLVKKSLAETVNSFYKFCYHHFQYKADDEKQYIKSPGCAWHSRNEGMDCKSFSVLASTLCSNAGLKHYIRKTKQLFFHPEQFTHVYVIVPNDQKTGELTNGYLIIDGTTDDNKEGVYIEKHDTYMEPLPHYGLNASRKTRIHPIGSAVAQKAINSCGRLKPGFTFNKGGRTITQHGLNGGIGLNGADTTKPFAAFCNLAKILNQAGVPKSITNEILKRLNEHVKSGIDPVVAISKDGIIIEGEFFRFQQPGHPKVIVPSIMIEFAKPAPGLGNTGEEGFDWGGVLDTAIGEIDGESDGWLQNIFSAITGFFSCYGSSATPKTAEDWAKDKVIPWATAQIRALTQIPGNQDTRISTEINKFMKNIATIHQHQMFHMTESKSKCGKDANMAMAAFVDKIFLVMQGVFQQMESDYTITKKVIPFEASANSIPGIADNWKGKKSFAAYIDQVFVLKPGATGGVPTAALPVYTTRGGGTTTPTTGGSTTPGGSTGGGSTIYPGGSNTTKQPQPQSAGINWILGAALIGGLIYGAKHFKNQPNKK